jgi:hypothetical protein
MAIFEAQACAVLGAVHHRKSFMQQEKRLGLSSSIIRKRQRSVSQKR